MSLDEQLLEKARTQAEQLAEAERQAQLARAEYHTAVRRLHLGGASLREIAEALSVSHQRVQQIVNEAGGSWWQRMWRSRNARDAICTFCGGPPAEVAKLIAGPNVYICDRCVSLAERSSAKSNGSPFVRARSPSGRCSFCSKRRSSSRELITAPAGTVCEECLRICRQILDDRAA